MVGVPLRHTHRAASSGEGGSHVNQRHWLVLVALVALSSTQADTIFVGGGGCPSSTCCFPTGDPVCDDGLNLIVKDIARRSASACRRRPCMKQATAT